MNGWDYTIVRDIFFLTYIFVTHHLLRKFHGIGQRKSSGDKYTIKITYIECREFMLSWCNSDW